MLELVGKVDYWLPRPISQRRKDLVRLGAGLIATIAALVLGLLIASAKSSADRLNRSKADIGACPCHVRFTPKSGPDRGAIHSCNERPRASRLPRARKKV